MGGCAVALLELHCGRQLWCGESDTVEIILAQVLGLIGARDGLPEDLLRRSPLDITKLYSPWPQHFPLRRVGDSYDAPLEELRPGTWGLGCVLGNESCWDQQKSDFASFVVSAMHVDHELRPSAKRLLNFRFIVGPAPPTDPSAEGKPPDEQEKQKQPETKDAPAATPTATSTEGNGSKNPPAKDDQGAGQAEKKQEPE